MAAAGSGARPKVLLLGLGNDLLTDDAVGLRVVRDAGPRLISHREVALAETSECGLALLDLMTGFDWLVLVDAIQTGKAPVGFVHQLELGDLKRLPSRSPHFLGIAELVALGRQLGIEVPQRVNMVAVEVQDPFTLGTELTPALKEALPGVVERCCELVRSIPMESAFQGSV